MNAHFSGNILLFLLLGGIIQQSDSLTAEQS